MFNNDLREDALERLKSEQQAYERAREEIVKRSEKLFAKRMQLKPVIDETWSFINSFRNKPTELSTELKEIQINTKRFSGLVESLEMEIERANITTGGAAAAGIAAGVGVAAFGPTAAMAIATTFGTASTGTAIASLSGAAATNAALAWLGGGIAAAGGGGMVAGSSLLALAGPVGWAIGGGALLTAGLMKSGKNKKVAEQANQQTVTISKHTKALTGINQEIQQVALLSSKTCRMLQQQVQFCRALSADYKQLSSEERQRLGALVNQVKAGVELLNRPVGGKG